jgi:mercuric ion transport protein
METDRKAVNAAAVGGLVAALLASTCCIGPLVFAALGVGAGATGFLAGTAGFLKVLPPYRPVFIGLTLLLIGVSFYLAYRRSKSALCAPRGVCRSEAVSGVNRTVLWVLTGLALALVLAPYWLGL